MREIKFRIFNKLSKNIEEVKKISFYENDFVVKPRCLKTKKMLEFVNSSECILLQYTGLKDKNGIEIYEGDIVTGDMVEALEVIWDKSYLTYILKVKNEHREDLCRVNNIEIIGNIYENKELLDVSIEK